MKTLITLLLLAWTSHSTQAAATKSQINTRNYAGICAYSGSGRSPIVENDKRGHAILKLGIEVSTLTSILSTESPQHKALCYMIYDDPKKPDPRGSGRGSFLDRYALVTLYVNTKGPGWVRSDMWLTKEPECNWYGVKCARNMFSLSPRVVGIDLSFNKVTGIIPRELGYMTELRELDLNGNSLQGVLPHFMLTNLKKLTKLNLHMNDLFGVIPKEIGKLTNLKELTLFGNFFFGKVPSEISNLKKLANLDLYANNLTGTIPADIGKMKQLKEFYINDNQVVGRMPKEICSLKLPHLVSDCLGARPEVPCDCCTICCQGLPDPKCKDMRATAVKKKK
jgi:Leucine-rich repeat (LRR) protein